MTTNTLGVYNPIFYAQEALLQLEEAMGMASRVYRAFEDERRTFGLGENIDIRRPSSFTATNAPDTTGQDATTETVRVSLSNWKEVKFVLTDKELAFTGERIINDHIRPAAVALANDIDIALASLYKDIGTNVLHSGNVGPPELTSVRRKMFDHKVPMDTENWHFMIDGNVGSELLQDSAFAQWQGAGGTGERTQVTGVLGRRYGYEFFENQNVQAHTSGTASDTSLAINNASGYAKGATTINLDAAGTGTIIPGDILTIGGDDYAVTNTTTAATNAHTGVTITPGLRAAVADDATVTLNTTDSTAEGLAFHRNAFALVMAPLPTMGNELGARVFTATDPITGLSLRARLYYVGNSSQVHVALDCLYGVKTLDPDMACRLRETGA